MNAKDSISVVTGIRDHIRQAVNAKYLTFVVADSIEDTQNLLIDLAVTEIKKENTGFYINVKDTRPDFLSKVRKTIQFRSGETLDWGTRHCGFMFGVTKHKGSMYHCDFNTLKNDVDLLVNSIYRIEEQPSFIILDSISESFNSLDDSQALYIFADYLLDVFPATSIIVGVHDFPTFDFKVPDCDILPNIKWAVQPFLDQFSESIVLCYTPLKSEPLSEVSSTWNSVAFTAYYQSFIENKTESKTYMIDQHAHFPVFRDMRVMENMNGKRFRYE